jgi:hypothetical protein
MTRRVSMLVAVLAIVLAACGDAGPESSSAPPRAAAQAPFEQNAPVAPAVSASPVGRHVTSSPSPSPSPSVEAKPDAAPTARWSGARRVAKRACTSMTAVIDDRGDDHVAALCESGIMYATRHRQGEWEHETLKPPPGSTQMAPQLDLDGDMLTLAYSQYASEVWDCGQGELSIEVLIRTRSLSDGTWSAPRVIGRSGDRLKALRTRDGTIHTVVSGPDGWTYQTTRGDRERRYDLGEEISSVSLQVDVQGNGNVLTTWGGHVAFGEFTGDGFEWERIPGADHAHHGLLMLGPAGEAHAVWTRTSAYEEGCGTTVPDDRDGTYYATNAGGKWLVKRVSKGTGVKSFTVDPSSGQVHLVVSGERLRYFTKPSGGSWTSTRLPVAGMRETFIRQDPASGRLLVLFMWWAEDGRDGSSIYELARD